MNGFSFPYENDIKNDKNEEELNNKIKEYKEVYNDNVKNPYSNNNNQIFSKNIIPSSENINLTDIENEYDTYITNLKLKLNQEREERKKKEEEFMSIHHRLIVLKNQEKSKILQLKNMKQHIDKIINNRIKLQEKLNEKLIEKRNTNKSTNANTNFIELNNFNDYNNSKSLSKSQNNFHNTKQKNFEVKINEPNQNKNNLKQILLEKIKKDQEEKKKIEEEIAKIEEEENNLLLQLSNNKISNE